MLFWLWLSPNVAHHSNKQPEIKQQTPKREVGEYNRGKENNYYRTGRAALLQVPYLFVATATFTSAVEQVVDLRKQHNIFWWLLPLGAAWTIFGMSN